MRVKFRDYQRWAMLATDLVLTAPEVWTAGERLAGPSDLDQFLERHELPHDGIVNRDLAVARTVRARARALVEDQSPKQRLEDASELTAGLVSALALDPAHREWTAVLTVQRPVELLAPLVGIGVLGTVQALGHERFRSCAAPTCNGAFIDTSRGGQRRYCMPDICGNRTNVALHRARTVTALSPN